MNEMKCASCASEEYTFSRANTKTCNQCGLVHTAHWQALGWPIIIVGRSGGIVPYHFVHPLLQKSDSGSVAELLYQAATIGFLHPDQIKDLQESENKTEAGDLH